MSTIIRHPNSKNLHVDIPTAEGPKRISTHTTNKEAAKIIGGRLHLFAKENEGKTVTKVAVMEAAQMLAKVVNTGVLEPTPIDEILPALAVQTAQGDGDKTMKLMIAGRFVEFMSGKGLGKLDIWNVCAIHVSEWLDHDKVKYKWGKRSVRTYGQCLGVMFEAAFNFKLVPSNVVRSVKLPARPKRSARRPFTDDELVKTYFAGDEEWREMILAGSASGMRIGDVSLLVVGDIDFETGFFSPLARKVNQIEPKPVPHWLLVHWKQKFEGLPADTPLFPRAYKWMWIQGKLSSSRVSGQFVELLYRAGVRQPGKVRGVERVGANKYLPLSFACLRHTYTTLLKVGNVSEAVARELVGHKSQAVSDSYTHIDKETAKAAVEGVHNPLKELLSKRADDQIHLFDTGHLPLGSWVMRFPKNNSWKGAVVARLEHARTTRQPKFLHISPSEERAAKAAKLEDDGASGAEVLAA
jgi:integrase